MANSTAFVIIKPTAALNRGNTFVFGSWVCTADGAGSLQRYLTMTPDLETGLVTLPEVIMGTLIKIFKEILLCNQAADFESRSTSNSNSTSPWVIACKLSSEPSCEMIPLHENYPYGLCNSSRAHVEALARRLPSSTPRTPTPHRATTRTPHTSSTSDQTQSSPSPRST
jgi:hypothetical protein